MKRLSILALSTLLVSSCGIINNNPPKGVESDNKTGDPFVVSGTYRYVDGDRLFWDCGKVSECEDTLVADDRLKASAHLINNTPIRLKVMRVDACSARSSEVACVRTLDGTVLLILEWLEGNSSN